MNPAFKNAVVLAYQANSGAPRVVAKGSGLIAEEIMARARQHGVFVHESKELVSLLMQVDLDREIPAALYRAVAELLAWLYALQSGVSDEVIDLSSRSDTHLLLPAER